MRRSANGMFGVASEPISENNVEGPNFLDSKMCVPKTSNWHHWTCNLQIKSVYLIIYVYGARSGCDQGWIE